MNEENKIIFKRVGRYSMGQANPEDCKSCHNAKWATVLANGVCLDCLLHPIMSGLEVGAALARDLVLHLKDSHAEEVRIPVELDGENYVVFVSKRG